MPDNGPPVEGLARLRQPFPPNQISKLPKPTKAQTDAVRADFKKGIRCEICGSWHHPDVIHLDYVGHAALTDRLLDVDPQWHWEPVGFTPEGLPALDRNNGLWIKLTVCGVTRYGYGAADGKTGGDAMKEIIGDALRNAAMRFGAALDLWHKGDLHGIEDAEVRDVEAERAGGEAEEPPLEPAEGWAAWALGLKGHLEAVESEGAINAARDDQLNKRRINALRTIDKALYESIGTAFADARARLAPPQKKAA